MEIPTVALGAVIAAFVSGLVTMLGLIISKENKTSEFRQAWVDGLRSEIAEYVGHLNTILGTVRIEGRDADAWRASKEAITAMNMCATSIRLRLNPSESIPKKLLNHLDEIEGKFVRQGILDEVRIQEIEKVFLGDAQVLLKKEWLRVRRGELMFSTVRWSSFIFLFGGIVVFAWFKMWRYI